MKAVWGHCEFGHNFVVEKLVPPVVKGAGARGFRLYDNGFPALGGQWHYTLADAIARARYIVQGSYSARIAFLEQRVQNLERQLHHVG
jgi:hypothetical protein